MLDPMTARDEILAVLPDLEFRSGDGTFTVDDVIGALRRRGSRYTERTIRTRSCTTTSSGLSEGATDA